MSKNIAESLSSKKQPEPVYGDSLIRTCEQLSRSDPDDPKTALVSTELSAVDGDTMADIFAARWAGVNGRNLCSADAIIQYTRGDGDSCLNLAEFKNRKIGEVASEEHTKSDGTTYVNRKFVFDNVAKYDDGREEDFELSIRRKLLETMLMLLLEDVSGVKGESGKRTAMIVVDAKANRISESDRARGGLEVFKEYRGTLFDSIKVITAKTFDQWAQKVQSTF